MPRESVGEMFLFGLQRAQSRCSSRTLKYTIGTACRCEAYYGTYLNVRAQSVGNHVEQNEEDARREGTYWNFIKKSIIQKVPVYDGE